jgi:glycosyltransferase involved in cell wall biosynthesis
MIKVSICIPTYSRLGYLKELVQSCLSQSYTNFEICISQDVTPNGLVDDIKSYCEELVKKNTGLVRYKAQQKNLGLAGNWNALLNMAEGEFIFIPGDDDLISKHFLERMLAHVYESSDVIFCNQNFIDPKSIVLQELTSKLNNQYKRDLLSTGFIEEPIGVVLDGSVPMSASLIRRKWFSKFSFDNLINTPELEVFLKIAVAGGRFVYLNEQLASFRVHPESATNSGLTTGRYISNIMDIEVPSKYFNLKAALITRSIIPAINNAIKKGEKQMAIKLFHSQYYPKNKRAYSISQKTLLILPNFISAFLLKLRG